MKKKNLVQLLCGVSALLSATCYSQTAPAAEPESTLTFNVGAVSDYRYRGISQSGTKPAVQFGADYTDKSGFYVGTWNSTITWIKDTGTANTKGPLETDLYGGYRGAFNDDVTYDVGVLQYLYSGNNLASVTGYSNANTTEIYGAINYGPAYIKLSDSVTNLFGFPSSSGSTYLDIGYNFDFGDGLTALAHIGNQTIKSTSPYFAGDNANVTAYTDYSLALNKDFDGLVLSGTIVGTDFSKRGNKVKDNLAGSGSKDLAGTSFVLGLKKNF